MAETVQVLVVEDNPVIRDLFLLSVDKLQHRLGERSIVVHQAEDGATAWKHIVEQGADVVVVDLYLPVLNGIELIRRIRSNSNTRNIKILAISASIQDARDRSLGAGADEFLQKPLRLVDLLEVMGGMLGLPEQ